MLRQFSRFTLVGIVATAAHYGIMTVLIVGLGVTVVVASAIGFVLSAVLNYRINYTLTFGSSLSHRRALPKFFAIAFIGLGLNCLLVWTLAGPVGIHWLISQAFASAVVLVWNFGANRRWTFASAVPE